MNSKERGQKCVSSLSASAFAMQKGLMKGQYRVVREIILFAIGVAITSFVVISFQNVESNTKELATHDQLAEISTIVSSGIIKAIESGHNASIIVKIPEEVSDEVYRIRVQDDTLILSIFDNPQINVTQKLFNMTYAYFITGDVVSTSKYIRIEFNPPNVVLKRAVIQ